MKPPFSFHRKTIWITGGAGYFGSAITQTLDADADKVLCIDRDGRAAALVQERKLTRTIPLDLDVSDATLLPTAVDELVAQHGVPDGLLHFPAASSTDKTFEALPADEFQSTFDRSVKPTFVLSRAVAAHMQPRGSGSIVLIASMYGMVVPDERIYHEPMKPNPVDYGVSKAGVIQLTRYLAMHYGPFGIRCNCIAPGPFPHPPVQTNTRFIEDLGNKTLLRRIGQNHEMVGPSLFLLSDSASYVTGHNLVVDGGWTVW